MCSIHELDSGKPDGSAETGELLSRSGCLSVASSVIQRDGRAVQRKGSQREADMSAHDEIVHMRRARETDARGIADVHVRTWQQAYRDRAAEPYLRR